MKERKILLGIMLFSFLLTLLIAVPVKASSTVVIEESEPMFEAEPFTQSNSQPYIGLYMTTDYCWYPKRGPNPKAVSVTVSFAGTDKSRIQSDNWLCAGIAAQGPDTVNGGCNAIDWGYVFCLVLDGARSDPYVHAEVIEGHEWVWCLPGYALPYYAWNAYIGGLTINSWVTLTMQWTDYSGFSTLDYSVAVDGVPVLFLQYFPAETAGPYFMSGTTDRYMGIIPLGNTVKWLQFFGAWSNYNIGQTGWHSYVKDPCYKVVDLPGWYYMPYAYSTDGANSFWDHVLRWGGDPYSNVNAAYSRNYVHFYSTTGTTLPPDTLLWTPPPPPRACPTLFAWSGTEYVDEGLLDIHAESDVTLFREIQTHLALQNGLYALELRELDNFTSHIDQVRLYGKDSNGQLHLCPLILARHGDDYVTSKLRFDDANRVDLAPGEKIELRFGPPIRLNNAVSFVFEINGYNRKPIPI